MLWAWRPKAGFRRNDKPGLGNDLPARHSCGSRDPVGDVARVLGEAGFPGPSPGGPPRPARFPPVIPAEAGIQSVVLSGCWAEPASLGQVRGGGPPWPACSPPVIPAEAGIQSVAWCEGWTKLASLGQARGGRPAVARLLPARHSCGSRNPVGGVARGAGRSWLPWAKSKGGGPPRPARSPPVIPAEAGIQSVAWHGGWAKLASLGQVRGGPPRPVCSLPVIPAEAGIQSVVWRGGWAKPASLGQVRGGRISAAYPLPACHSCGSRNPVSGVAGGAEPSRLPWAKPTAGPPRHATVTRSA